jgi:D-3-phosphoglycerate dehydrogenase
MPDNTPIAVTSRSFSRHPVLREELIARYDNVHFNDEGLSLQGAALIDFLRGRRKVITGLETVDDALLSAVPELNVIAKYGVGLDMIDMEAMTRHGVHLGWKGGVNRRSVAELVLGFMISLLHLVPECDRDLRAETWQNKKGRQLTGRTIGIVGCGHIGKDLTGLLAPFGCRILANDIRDFPEFYAENGVEPVSLDQLLEAADIVTLHIPLNAATHHIMNAGTIARMRRGAILINAARGGLVDEAALKAALQQRHLQAAAFDVFAIEPPEDWELFKLPNFLGTPHIGGSTEEAILAMGRAAIAGLDDHALPDADNRPTG